MLTTVYLKLTLYAIFKLFNVLNSILRLSNRNLSGIQKLPEVSDDIKKEAATILSSRNTKMRGRKAQRKDDTSSSSSSSDSSEK